MAASISFLLYSLKEAWEVRSLIHTVYLLILLLLPDTLRS
jgi:hypothetical protein